MNEKLKTITMHNKQRRYSVGRPYSKKLFSIADLNQYSGTIKTTNAMHQAMMFCFEFDNPMENVWERTADLETKPAVDPAVIQFRLEFGKQKYLSTSPRDW